MSSSEHALSSCPFHFSMAGRTPLLPARLLSDFDSVVMQMFQSVDGNSRCACGERYVGSCMIKLTWIWFMYRFEVARLAEVEHELVNQIAALKHRHQRRRSFSLCRILTGMLTRTLSFLSAKDQPQRTLKSLRALFQSLSGSVTVTCET